MVNYIKNIKKEDELINELKKENEELKVHDKMQKEFINVAAHEIKTPIQPIIALSELLQQEEGNNNIEKNKQLLDIIFRNSKRLKQLTDDVLDVASIESGSFFLNKEKFNLKEMITDDLKEYEQTIQNKNNIKFLLEFNDNNDEIIIVEAEGIGLVKSFIICYTMPSNLQRKVVLLLLLKEKKIILMTNMMKFLLV